ncbi:hypothetical protein CAEBREN_16205 [Caenorhabditis brenneri]|uniref:Uncharacterized protein n=1 Tax=Caenorhabditis brenneri TaxID=135651 RepID=G0PEI4_CAEBE|nr:hypothetical protein CAEBREN_16205 [Caenorhabditis brenneri]
MAQQHYQIAGCSTNYFHPSPPPPQNHDSPNEEQSNNRKRPRILGGMRARDSIEEKRIRITEENLAEAEKIKEAASVSKPHRALQTAYDPFMGNMTDSEKEEEALSDEEMVENVDPYYEDLSRKQDIMFQLSRLPPPRLGDDSTAELPEPKREYQAMKGVMKKKEAPGSSYYSRIAESVRTPIRKEETNETKKVKVIRRKKMTFSKKKSSAAKPKARKPTCHNELATLKKGPVTYSWFDPAAASTPMPSVFSGSDRSASQSPSSRKSKTPKLVQKVNTPAQPPVESKRQDSVGSQPSTSSQGSSSTKRSKSKKKKVVEEPQPEKSYLEDEDNLKIFLNVIAPTEVVKRENEELYRKKRGPKNQSSELLVGMLNGANSL